MLLLVLVFLSQYAAVFAQNTAFALADDRVFQLAPPMPQLSSEASELNFTIPFPVPRPSAPVGPINVLVIAVEFSDYNHTMSTEQVTSETIGRLNEYYTRVSYGMMSVVGRVVGWVKMPYRLASYGMDNGPFIDDQDGDGYPDSWKLLRDAIPLITSQVNLADYQEVIVLHAGYGQESSGKPSDIWSVAYMRWLVETPAGHIETFAIIPEFEARGLGTLGVTAHEFAHLLGLPDLYSSSNEQVGPWDLMARGAWNGNPQGTSPAEMVAWNRIFLGWMAPERVMNLTSQARTNATLDPIELPSSRLQAVRLQPSPSNFDNYYLIEVRQALGYDVALPSFGVLITYIDETKSNPVKVIDAVQTTTTLNDAPFQAGQKYIDSQNNVIISVLSTDGSSYTVAVDTTSPRAHVVIQGFTINPATVHPNETASVDLEVMNEGTLKSKTFLVNLYLNDTIYVSRRISLTPGQAENIRAVWKPTATGVYVFKAEVDPEHLVTEAGDNTVRYMTIIVGYTLALEMRPPGAGGDLEWWIIVNGANQTFTGVGEFQIGVLPGQNSLEIQSSIYLNPSSRYVFREWSDGVTANPRDLAVDQDVQMAVNFDAQYLLSLEPNGGVTSSGGWFDSGTTATVSATSPSNVYERQSRWIFVSWSGDLQSDSATITLNMTRPYTVIANWKSQYYLYVQSPYGVSGDGWYDADSPAIVSLTSLMVTENGTRHQFIQWEGDLSGSDPNQQVMMSGPKYVSALWTTEYELSLESELGHTVGTGWYIPNAPASFMVDTLIVETANDTRRTFTSWSGDFQSTAPSGSIIMDGPKSLHVNWGTQYLVTLEAGGVRDGTYLTIRVDGQSHQIKVPENVTLWLDAGSSISFSANETATQGFRRFLFVEWKNVTGGTIESPQTISNPERFTAAYKELSISPCIIATVTFGSELSPEVQFLRGFRDRLVLSTRAGSAFMTVFNTWYYSFSPKVADYIASNDFSRAPMRIVLYPLMGILTMAAATYSALAFTPELAIVAAGILASMLIGLVYFTPVALVIRRVTRRTACGSLTARTIATAYVAIVSGIVLGELTGWFWMLAVASSALVLITVGLTALLASRMLFACWRSAHVETRLASAIGRSSSERARDR